MPSNHLTLCRPLLLLPSIFSSIWVFSNRLFPSGGQSISPSSENSGLISFSIYWFKLFAVQGTLKNLLQHHSSKASVLQWSGFFMVQLLHPYITTGKTITLTRWTFVSKIMSLLFNTLSRFVMAFLPRSKCLLISWLQSPSAAPENSVSHCFRCFPIYLPWSDETRCHNLRFFFYFFFYCSGFCHTLKWNSHGFICVPHPDPPSHLPLHLIPLGLPSAPVLSTCLMHPTWAGDLFHPR